MSALKELKVAKDACNRLAKEVRFYIKEKKQHDDKYQKLVDANADPHDLKKQKEFVDESDAVLADTIHQGRKSYAKLQTIVASHGENEAIKASKEYEDALKILADSAATFDIDTKEEKKAPSLRVSVFGSHRAVKGDALYTFSESVGRALAQANAHVMTGGYGGTMEGVSEGACSVHGAVVEGIICPPVFPERGRNGNRFLTIETRTCHLHERIHRLASADAFVVLPGQLGTLNEFVMVWNQSVCNHFSRAPPLAIFAVRDPWEPVCKALGESLDLTPEALAQVVFFDTAEQLAELVAKVTPRVRA